MLSMQPRMQPLGETMVVVEMTGCIDRLQAGMEAVKRWPHRGCTKRREEVGALRLVLPTRHVRRGGLPLVREPTSTPHGREKKFSRDVRRCANGGE